MKDIAIDFNKVSKKFRKGQRLYLKQALLDLFKPDQQEDFWALKDVSFQIQKGESVGIIGVNGSGKSTILKLIAGVMTPTSGKVDVEGRIGPLIELGAGFHPELTGRDNIYLNGTILGLSKKEVNQKFDDIVSFSELEEFIDTPVKHYSSGMYMRLGFSIAINIDPDILLVDEILAVGDIGFQKKCIEKIQDFKNRGGTILYVSHDTDFVRGFSSRVIFLNKGKLIAIGDPNKVVPNYIMVNNTSERQEENNFRWGDGKAQITNIWIEDNTGKKKASFGAEMIKIKFKVKFFVESVDPIFGITIRSLDGRPIFVSNTLWSNIKTGRFHKGEEKIINWEIHNHFGTGKYSISPAIAYSDAKRFYDWRDNCLWLVIKKPSKSEGVLNLDHKIFIQ